MDLPEQQDFGLRTTRDQSDLLCKTPIFLSYLLDIPFVCDLVIVFLKITPVLFNSFLSIRSHHRLEVYLLHTSYLLEFPDILMKRSAIL
jgi:hypothetical protein